MHTNMRVYIYTIMVDKSVQTSAIGISEHHHETKAGPGGEHRGHVPPFSFPNYILIFK